MRLVWVVIPILLIGIIGIQESFAEHGTFTDTSLPEDIEYIFSISKTDIEDFDYKLLRPVSVSADDNRIYVVDTKYVHVYSKNGEHLFHTHKQSMEEQLKLVTNPSPRDIIVKHNKIYLASGDNHQIQIFSDQGEYLFSFGKKGFSDGEFLTTNSIAVDRFGKMYVVDMFTPRIQIFDADSKFLSSFNTVKDSSWESHFPISIAVDDDGKRVYVIMNEHLEDNRNIQVYSDTGTPLFIIEKTNGIEFKDIQDVTIRDNLLYVVNSELSEIYVFSLDGKFLYKFGQIGHNEGQFSHPNDIAVNGNLMYVADTNNDRIQVFTLDDKLVPEKTFAHTDVVTTKSQSSENYVIEDSKSSFFDFLTSFFSSLFN